MPGESIHHPNDKLLKATFSNPDNARGFFQNYLPTQISHAADWNSLRLESSTFVDPHFAESESDLLFSLKLAQSDAFIYLLFEHQSSEDPRMALRLLLYILRICELFAAAHPAPAKLPAILPIVLAQGKRLWKTAPRLDDLIDLPTELANILRPWQPTLIYFLLELVRIPYEGLAGTPEGIMTLRAFKSAQLDEAQGTGNLLKPQTHTGPGGSGKFGHQCCESFCASGSPVLNRGSKQIARNKLPVPGLTGHRLTAELHAVAAHADFHHAATRAGLSCEEVRPAEFCLPVRPQRAIRRAGQGQW